MQATEQTLSLHRQEKRTTPGAGNRHTQSQYIWCESKPKTIYAESQLPGPALKHNYKFYTEAYAEDKPPQSHAKISLFILAKKQEVELRKAFSQVVNSDTKCSSGVFKFKTSWTITAGRMSTVMLPLLFPNWGQQLKAFIRGTWAFISDHAKYFIQKMNLQRLGNSSKK